MRSNVLILLIAGMGLLAQTPKYDLLLKGGRVVDGRNNIDAPRDVAIKDGKIAAVEASIPATDATKVLDVRGLLVTPGLIDLHVHVFHTSLIPDAWAGDNSVQPDLISFRTGVTTMVDAGSSGYRNFPQFRATVIDRAQTRILAMINIAGYGMMTNVVEQNTSDMLPDKAAEMARRHKDVVVGIKTAHFEGPEWTAVDRAMDAARQAGLPLMVDFGFFRTERPYWQLVTSKLRPGDISTHMFRGSVPWVDKNGNLYSYLQKARDRGVRFDVGHGGGSFVMRNAAPALAQKFYPDTVSTDLHFGSMNAGMMDMPTTMSKLLALGMPLREVLVRSTWTPAQLIGRTELGHLSVGAIADVTALRLIEGDFAFRDQADARARGKQRLQAELTLKDGKVVWDMNSLSGTDWQQLPPDYGIRPGIDHIVPPPDDMALRQLHDTRRWFELREAAPKTGMWAGLVANHFGRHEDAVRLLSGSKDATALEALAGSYVRLGRYREAAETYKKLATEDAANNATLFTAIADVSPQAIRGGGPASLKITRDAVGLSNIPVAINGQETSAIFDTGANFSVLTRSEAARLGVAVREADFTVGAITGKKVPAGLGVGSVCLGNATITNTIFLVLNDADLYFEPVKFQIKSIIGAPVITALQRIRLTRDTAGETLDILPPGPVSDTPNLAFDGLDPVVLASFRGQPLQFAFDSGAVRTMLYAGFHDRFGREVPSKPHTARTGGAGGIVTREALLVDNFSFEIAGKPVTLARVVTHLEHDPEERRHYDGNLGQDVLRQFKAVTLDFRQGRLTLE